MIKIFRGKHDYVLQNSRQTVRVTEFSFDALFQSSNPADYLRRYFETDAPGVSDDLHSIHQQPWLAPIAQQEVWAAGVTYFRSRSARMEESEQSGGDRFYDLVYDAERPELFFKATGPRARGHLDKVCIRSDSSWNVP